MKTAIKTINRIGGIRRSIEALFDRWLTLFGEACGELFDRCSIVRAGCGRYVHHDIRRHR